MVSEKDTILDSAIWVLHSLMRIKLSSILEKNWIALLRCKVWGYAASNYRIEIVVIFIWLCLINSQSSRIYNKVFTEDIFFKINGFRSEVHFNIPFTLIKVVPFVPIWRIILSGFLRRKVTRSKYLPFIFPHGRSQL